MSVLQTVLSRLLPGYTAGKSTSVHDTSSSNSTRSSLGQNGSVAASQSTGSSSALPQDEELGYFKRHYGLGLLVAKCVPGVRNPLRFLARKVRLANTPSDNTFCPSRTPSPFALNDPQTPDEGHAGYQPLGLAHASSSKVQCPPSLTDATRPHGPMCPQETQQPTAQRGRYYFVDSAAMYIAALRSYYPIPPSRRSGLMIPALQDTPGLAEASRTDTQPAWAPVVPTAPAHQDPGSLVPTAPAHPQPCAGEKRRRCDADSVESDNGDEGEDGDDCTGYEDDLLEPCPIPRHPDGTEYHILGRLGDGGFGRVMLAGTPSGELVALKVLHKPMLYLSHDGRRTLHNERNLMERATKANLPFLMHLQAAWEQGDNVFLAMDLCAETLRSRIRRAVRSGSPIPEVEKKLLCAEMLHALVNLTSLGIVHGDIKPDNILISKTGGIVLSDFGHSQCAYLLDAHWDSSRPFHEWSAPETVGTPGYYSPEALLREYPDSTATFTSKSDVFSLGLVFVELLCDFEYPLWDPVDDPVGIDVDIETWRNMDTPQRQASRMMIEGIRAIVDGDVLKDENAKDMIQLMLLADPKHRPTPEELLEHPYFADLDKQAVLNGTAHHSYTPQFFSSLQNSMRDMDLRFPTFAECEGKGFEQDKVYQEQNRGPLENFTYPEGEWGVKVCPQGELELPDFAENPECDWAQWGVPQQ
ncbi:kinase-like domain-containing protein [Cubamyces lactineus]|nr:kinase-like domain-containing protein [Cubamyces lactineus]